MSQSKRNDSRVRSISRLLEDIRDKRDFRDRRLADRKRLKRAGKLRD